MTTKIVSKEYLDNEYTVKGKSIRRIADELSTGMATIQRWLVRYDIPRRSKSDYKIGLETRKLISESQKKNSRWSGEGNPNWAGGVSRERHGERSNGPVKAWRHAVKVRDDWVCQKCGLDGKQKCEHCGVKPRMHADHIKPWKDYPELRFDISNGRTLCEDCHIRRIG